MKCYEFLASLRDGGGFETLAEAENTATAVLAVLGSRLEAGERKDLASQLPEPLDAALHHDPDPERGAGTFGVSEFLDRVAAELNTSPERAREHARAVLTTLAHGVTGGQLNQLVTQLQPGYAALFGKPELS